jgi:hypothetical protein
VLSWALRVLAWICFSVAINEKGSRSGGRRAARETPYEDSVADGQAGFRDGNPELIEKRLKIFSEIRNWQNSSAKQQKVPELVTGAGLVCEHFANRNAHCGVGQREVPRLRQPEQFGWLGLKRELCEKRIEVFSASSEDLL